MDLEQTQNQKCTSQKSKESETLVTLWTELSIRISQENATAESDLEQTQNQKCPSQKSKESETLVTLWTELSIRISQENATAESDLEQTQNHAEKSTEVSVEKSQILLSRKSVSVSELIPRLSGENDRRPIATSIDGENITGERQQRMSQTYSVVAPKRTVQDWEIFL